MESNCKFTEPMNNNLSNRVKPSMDTIESLKSTYPGITWQEQLNIIKTKWDETLYVIWVVGYHICILRNMLDV